MTAEPRVTLVTGGARRVGAAIVRAAAAAGHHVVVHTVRRLDAAEALAQDIRASGGRADVLQGDLRDPSTPSRLVRDTLACAGRLDVLVNSAASFVRAAPLALTVEEWDDAFDVNVRAPFLLAQAAAPHMAAGSAIVNIADHLAFEHEPAMLAHAAAKSALIHVTRTLARALAPTVRVNAVAPGLVAAPEEWTEAQVARFVRDVPLARSGTPEEVARAVLFLADASYVTGVVLPVDGGRGLMR